MPWWVAPVILATAGGCTWLSAALREKRRDPARIPTLLDELAARVKGSVVVLDGQPELQLRTEAADISVAPDGVPALGDLESGPFMWRAALHTSGTAFRAVTRKSNVFVQKASRASIGHELFDALFVVHGEDPEAIQRACRDSEAFAVMTELGGRVWLAGTPRALELRGDASSIDQLAAGIELLLSIAATDPYAVRALRGLAGARRHVDDRGIEIAVLSPGDIRVGAEKHGRRVVTCARAERAGGSDAGTLELVAGRAIDPDLLAPLPVEARARLAELGDAHVAWSGRDASIVFPSIVTDAGRLEGAVAVLRALIQPPPMGVFR